MFRKQPYEIKYFDNRQLYRNCPDDEITFNLIKKYKYLRKIIFL